MSLQALISPNIKMLMHSRARKQLMKENSLSKLKQKQIKQRSESYFMLSSPCTIIAVALHLTFFQGMFLGSFLWTAQRDKEKKNRGKNVLRCLCTHVFRLKIYSRNDCKQCDTSEGEEGEPRENVGMGFNCVTWDSLLESHRKMMLRPRRRKLTTLAKVLPRATWEVSATFHRR